MTLRSPLGRALGHGSVKGGVGHWWMQRVTAVALVPLALWFVFALLEQPSLDYLSMRAWIGDGWTPVLLLSLVGALTYHSALGVQVVIEDYVHGKAVKLAALLASTFAHLFVAIACSYAILKISFV